MMTNIPTDLLRTLVAIVDLRSFTKAAQALGVTQPAVSAQIKRLQLLIGSELLDKSAPGVALTPRGETVVAYARRLLSINDQILHLTASRASSQILRIGIPADLSASAVASVLSKFRAHRPEVRFVVRSGSLELLLRDLQQDELDLAIGLAMSEPAYEPRHWWAEEAVWIRSDAVSLDPGRPVPLVSRGDECPCHRAAVTALHEAGRACEFVFTAQSLVALQSAVALGFGPMVLIRSMVTLTHAQNIWSGLHVWEDAPLPQLPRLHRGIFLREGGNREVIEAIADDIAQVLRLAPGAEPQADGFARARSASRTG